MTNENMFKAPTKKGIRFCPGPMAGRWSPPAYSPQTSDVYVLGLNQLMTYTTSKVNTVKGQMRLGSTFKTSRKTAFRAATSPPSTSRPERSTGSTRRHSR